MPYPKRKVETYSNVGGINQKASLYKTGENEVLDLVNLDFSEPGSWTKRWGFTNTLISGNTLTIGASQVINDIWQLFKDGVYTGENQYLSPQLRFIFGHNAGVFKINSMGYNNPAGSTTFIYSPMISGYTAANWDHVVYKTQSYFAADGQIYKYTPNTFPTPSSTDDTSYFGMSSPPTQVSAGGSLAFGASGTGTMSGTFMYQYAYVDQYSFIGPRSATYTASSANNAFIAVSGFTTGNSASFGYSSYGLFRNNVPGFPTTDMVLIAKFTGATYLDGNTFAFDPFYIDPVLSFSPINKGVGQNYTFSSRFMEIYQNRLWANLIDNSSFTGDPALSNRGSAYTLRFSEADDLQTFYPESFITVEQNGFTITGIKSFDQCLMIFCDEGVFRLTGDAPENFNQQLLTTEYGCISNKAIVEFKNRLWFLDETQIIEFNGSQMAEVSQRVNETLYSMNIPAARQKACALHIPDREEVWFAIPVNGSSINNIIVVHDYAVNAWTTFRSDKLKPTALSSVYRGFGFESSTLSARIPIDRMYIFGSIGASLFNFGQSLMGDDGAGATLSFRTRFHDAGGSKSSTAQFRRFFLDAKISSGTSQIFGQTISLSFYANYASNTISLTLPLSLTTFTENRVDFGIPAKSLATEVAYGSSNLMVNFYGYTIESRYQRSV